VETLLNKICVPLSHVCSLCIQSCDVFFYSSGIDCDDNCPFDGAVSKGVFKKHIFLMDYGFISASLVVFFESVSVSPS